MKNIRKITALVLAVAISLVFTACGDDRTREGGEITTTEITSTAAESTLTKQETAVVSEELFQKETITDREGNQIDIPSSVDTIISAAPSVTEILAGLGIADRIIAADTYSADVEGIDPSICTLDFYTLNIEQLMALNPDAIIINGISVVGDDDPYRELKNAGINVIYIPAASSIEAIKLDIEFLAAYTDTSAQGEQLISQINTAVADITSKSAAVTSKKKVYFEMGAAPYLYSCGSNTFIDEIISLTGAENIYASENGWLSNSEESVIAANPDVILTSVSYDGYDFNEIKARAGWENLNAVKSGEVYQVDANAVSRASQNIVKGIYEIARAIYPDIYSE